MRMNWNGEDIIKQIEKAAKKGLFEASHMILEESNELVPLDSGDLMSSGGVSVDRNDVRTHISYDEKYALKQHEDLSLKHPNGREAKFLEKALKENEDKALEHIQDTIDKEMR